MTSERLAPALLLDATWWGTLAAARDLGSRGVPVTLACDARIVPARWSRHVARAVRSPDTSRPARLLEWLLEFGARCPGHVLYPTSDEVAWLVAANQEELARYYRLYSPPLEALASLLDKRRLDSAARAAGLGTPDSWHPTSDEEVTRLAREMSFPVYVKPRTQVFASLHAKGQRVESASDLPAVWRRWQSLLRFPPEVSRQISGPDRPLVQATCSDSTRVYTLDGFIDKSGKLFGTLACVKVLQRPRGSGLGVCFEKSEVRPELEAAMVKMFRAVGFHGVFDAEFLEDSGRHLLIDVNPRFYNHMMFEIDRGLPLPWLAYLGAVGDVERMSAELKCRKDPGGAAEIYVHRLPLNLMLALQTLTGRMALEERRRWRDWAASQRHICDPVRLEGDAGPSFAELALELVRFLKHPRAHLRGLLSTGPLPNANAASGPPKL